MHLNEVFTYLSAFLIGGVNMSKKYNRDAFETTNSGNDLHGKGANQQDNTSQSNATEIHSNTTWTRDRAFEKK